MSGRVAGDGRGIYDLCMIQGRVLAKSLGLVLLLTAASHVAGQISYELNDEGFQKVDQPDPTSPTGRLQAARTALAEGEAKRATKLLNEWIGQNPYSPLMAEALLLRGDSWVARKEYYKSLFDYEKLLRQYPGSPQFKLALEREFEIAELFGSGVRRKLWGMRWITATGEAEELYIRIQERAPGSKLAERAGIALGDFYYDRGDMWLATEMYTIFSENYPRSQWSAHAMQRQIEANWALFKGPNFDATGLFEAERHLMKFKQEHPAEAERAGADEQLARIDEQLANKQLNVARWYERVNKMVSARYMYRRVVTDHPRSSAAIEAANRLRELGETVEIPDAPAPKPTPAADDPPAPEKTFTHSDADDKIPQDSEQLPESVTQPQEETR